MLLWSLKPAILVRQILMRVYISSRMRPRLSPFDFDVQSQTFPSLCLQLLPPPPSLFAASPFSSPSSFPLEPPGAEHLDMVRQALRAKIAQWQSDQLLADSTQNPQAGAFGMGMDSNMIARGVQQHEDMSLRHLELAFKHWLSIPPEEKHGVWQLEITRAFAKEMEKRKSLDEQLARVQQEANQLRSQVERLGSCQWPREFALFPPDTLPLPRDVARELNSKEGQVNSSRWDYNNVVAKWKRVVMHDKSMGRVGVGYSNPATDEQELGQPAGDEGNSSRSKPQQQTGSASSPENQSSPQTSGPSASSNQHASPYLYSDTSRSPNAGGPQAKRPRLMNGHANTPNAAPDGPGPSIPTAPTNQRRHRASNSWTSNSHQPLMVSNLSAPSAPNPSSNSGI